VAFQSSDPDLKEKWRGEGKKMLEGIYAHKGRAAEPR
jgi:hypothetical protein